MIRPCTQIDAFAGLRWVKESGHSQMLSFAGCSALIGQRPAIYKELLICYLRWDKMHAFQLLFILLCQILFFSFFSTDTVTLLSSGLRKGMWCISWWSQTGPSKCWDWESITVLHSSYLSLSSDGIVCKDNSDFHTHILFRNFVVSRHTLWLTSELDNCVASESIRASCTCHVLLHLHLKCFSNGHNLLCRDAVNCLKTFHNAK